MPPGVLFLSCSFPVLSFLSLTWQKSRSSFCRCSCAWSRMRVSISVMDSAPAWPCSVRDAGGGTRGAWRSGARRPGARPQTPRLAMRRRTAARAVPASTRARSRQCKALQAQRADGHLAELQVVVQRPPVLLRARSKCMIAAVRASGRTHRVARDGCSAGKTRCGHVAHRELRVHAGEAQLQQLLHRRAREQVAVACGASQRRRRHDGNTSSHDVQRPRRTTAKSLPATPWPSAISRPPPQVLRRAHSGPERLKLLP